jgi:glycosyltransferase involved in cell wall biosynthesis
LIGLKGQAVFLRSLGRVRKRWGGPLSVEIIGGGPDQERLRELASELGVSDVVHIHGFVPDEELIAQYARASLFVLPSVNDAAPLAILEAMASGLPVVASAVGGIPEVLAGNEKALFPAGDESALAEAIVRMISDPSLSDSTGKRNRERAMAFDWDTIARRYLDLYREVAARAKSGAPIESASVSQPPGAGQV